MSVWVVGKNLYDESPNAWEFQGVFDSEEKALDACAGRSDYFIGPAQLNAELPYETMDCWPGAYRVCDA